jgi:hypothetical protein
MQEEETHIKVLFRYDSKVLGEEVVETMWAIPIDQAKGLYQLDSIPFYGPPIAPGDTFLAEFDEVEQQLTFREVEEFSGSSVIQVVLMQEPYGTIALRKDLSALGGISEGLNDRFFALEVPPKVDYAPIRELLDSLKQQGCIDFAEPVLSDQHR